MTYKEALILLNDVEFADKYQGKEEYKNMLMLCKQALEKQMPKKPINIEWKDKEGKWISRWTCPHCMFNYLSTIYSHCWRCGQRIDWVETLS